MKKNSNNNNIKKRDFAGQNTNTKFKKRKEKKKKKSPWEKPCYQQRERERERWWLDIYRYRFDRLLLPSFILPMKTVISNRRRRRCWLMYQHSSGTTIAPTDWADCLFFSFFLSFWLLYWRAGHLGSSKSINPQKMSNENRKQIVKKKDKWHM